MPKSNTLEPAMKYTYHLLNAPARVLTSPTSEINRFMGSEYWQIKAIYEVNLPKEVRKPFHTIVNGIEQGNYICAVANDPLNGDIAAFAFLLPLPDTPYLFLEYIAVSAARQNQGIGSALFNWITNYISSAGIAESIIWEVEPIGPDSSDNTLRRIRFYECLGGRIINASTPYAMPDFENNHENGVPHRLMMAPMYVQPGIIEVCRMIEAIYRTAYPGYLDLRDKIIGNLKSVYPLELC